jgi:pimeloyl-ACP methyl ester carboxylesterase
LLPGTLCTSAIFDGFLDALGVQSTQRHHVQLDRPSVEDYQADFDRLPVDTIVCGFSLGAIVAAHCADRMQAHALVLFGLNPFADDPEKAQSRHDLAADVMELGGAAALQKRTLEIHGQAPNKTRGQIYAMADASADCIAAQTRLALTRPGALPALAIAQMPVLSLTGSQDTSAPPAQGLVAAQTAAKGQFHSLDGLGHFALLEDPAACAAAVKQLLEHQHDIA